MSEVIRSRDNPRVKRWAKLARDARARREAGRAIIEGPHLVEAARQAGVRIVSLMAQEDAGGRAPDGVDVQVLSESALRAISDVRAPQGLLAEIEIPRHPSRKDAGVVLLEGVQDAGNAGALVRTAAAFDIGTVVFDAGCADPWSPKVLRAGAGAHFALSIVQEAAGAWLDAAPGCRVVTAVAHGGTPLAEADLSGRLAWVFGAEGAGVSESLLARADLRVTVPTAAVESLNVAAAAAVCLYEAHRRKAGTR